MKKLNAKQFMCVRVAVVILLVYAIAAIEGLGTKYGVSWRSFGPFALVLALFTGLFIYAFRDKPAENDKNAPGTDEGE